MTFAGRFGTTEGALCYGGRRAPLLASLCLLTLLGACRSEPDSDKARSIIASYGCQTCHVIPGAPQPQGVTGPPLDQMAEASYVAGVLPNSQRAMVSFIVDPQKVDPRSAMPDLGVTEAEAEEITKYLYRVSGER